MTTTAAAAAAAAAATNIYVSDAVGPH